MAELKRGTRVTGETRGADRTVTGTLLGPCIATSDLDPCWEVDVDGEYPMCVRYVEPEGLTLTSVPDDVLVVRNNVSGNRRYLHRTSAGPGGTWVLSEYATHIDAPDTYSFTGRQWNRAVTEWFTGQAVTTRTGWSRSPQSPDDFEIVVRGEFVLPTQEEEKTVREFIGARPSDVGPKYQTPFQLDPEDSSNIVDGQGHHVATVDLDLDYESGEDARMAQIIADALNEKYGE